MIKNIGVHRVRHGDVMENLDELYRGEKADLFYSDPPWGQGNLSYWQTMNVKQNEGEQKKQIDYWNFIERIADLAYETTKPDALIFIEYGNKWNGDLVSIMEQKGMFLLATIPAKYKTGSNLLPLSLNIFSKKKEVVLPDGYIEHVKDTHGFECISRALEPFAHEGKLITDPCCGMGYTAQVALNTGMRFIGNELNLKRLNKTIERLENGKVRRG